MHLSQISGLQEAAMSSLPRQRIQEFTSPLRLVNADPKYPKATLIPPTIRGYLYVAAAVRPGTLPVVLPSAHRSQLLNTLKTLTKDLAAVDAVVKIDLFRALVMPPTASFSAYLKERRTSLRVANFDVLLLIQTTSPATARNLQDTPAYRTLVETVRREAERVHIMSARNVRRIGDVDTTREGLFLFNHFAADHADVMLELWEYLAVWYVKDTGLRNSIALMPTAGESSDYTIVNWARWDTNPVRHFWHQLSKRSFWKYVTTNLDVNRAASMPIYCRLA
jgi:hypothetical protein